MENSTPTIDIKSLTPEQKAEMMRQLEAERQEAEKAKQAEKDHYNAIKTETVSEVYNSLETISNDLVMIKERMLNSFRTLVDLKADLFGVDEKQMSHSWTSADGTVTIITGFNHIDRWDETVSAGIAKVNAWIDNQTNDHNRNMIDLVRNLLKPNKDGVLKASRVLELQNSAERIGDPELLEAVKIIRASHRPDKTGSFIKCKYKDADGKWQWMPLSMSQA